MHLKKFNSFTFEGSYPPVDKPAGIGLRYAHYKDVIELRPPVGWLEVHPENYFGGGEHRHYLFKAREFYPMSFHAVGLSLGSVERVSRRHLENIKELIALYEPFQVSDHAARSMSGNAHLNDLLPLPYTEETLSVLCRNIDETQDFLGRRIFVENPSTYLAFKDSIMPEWEFMNEAARRTGCGILLDINNIYVQSRNHSFDAFEYITCIEKDFVCELHLAGHTERQTADGSTVLIDTHDSMVRSEVWELYTHAIDSFGSVPTLIEWDQNFPPLATLVAEAERAVTIIKYRILNYEVE
jgi:uncharacterized protein (UPF0276 family)